MKPLRYLKIVLWVVLFSIFRKGYSQSFPGNGFINLQCGQFIDGNGNPFYPLLMNYSIDYQFPSCNFDIEYCTHPSGCSTYFMAPYGGYGADSSSFDCTDPFTCSSMIDIDLAKIKAMGFNMIRPNFSPLWTRTCHTFRVAGWGSPPGDNWEKHYAVFDPPDETDPDVINYFTDLDTLIAKAARLGMKTMINGALGDLSEDSAFAACKIYLAALGRHFKDNKDLAFYDITSEPSWGYSHAANKAEACDLITQLYDVLKTADPNHLITGGNNSIDETQLFDPGVVKLDFTQPHFYGTMNPNIDSSLTNLLNRVKGHAYWMSKNCPIPWMQGETGFPSSDKYFILQHDKLQGTNAQQKIYADSSLAIVRDYGGLGTVWWDYQDGSYPSPTDGFGLLKVGFVASASDTSNDKPAAKSFKNYLDPITHQPPPINTANAVKPPNYYDPYLNGTHNTPKRNAVSGTIKDANNNPVEDAYITSLNWLYFDPKQPFDTTDDVFEKTWLYTFSDSVGHFEMIPYNYHTLTNDKILNIRGSAVGAEIFERSTPQFVANSYRDSTQMPTNAGTINIHFATPISQNGFVSSQTVTSGTVDFKAKNTLNVTNSSIASGASSTMKARCDVIINTEFVADYGSEVVLENGEVKNECTDYAAFVVRQPAKVNNGSVSEEGSTENIELTFLKNNEPDVMVFPNPNKGTFTVKIKITDRSNVSTIQAKFRNLVGESLREFVIFNESSVIDVSEFNNGIYLLEFIQDQKRIVKKIVINK